MISSAYFLLLAIVISFSVKTYCLSQLVPQGLRAKKIQKPWLFLLGVLAGSMFGDLAWGVKLVREIWMPFVDYRVVTFCIRIAWGFLIIQYQSLSLFIESVIEKRFKMRTFSKVLIFLGSCISLYFFYLAFFDNSMTGEFEREQAKLLVGEVPLEISVMRFSVYYLFNLLLLPSCYLTFKKMGTVHIPKILRKQLHTLLKFLIFPYIGIECIQGANFLFTSFQEHLYAIVGVATILLSIAIFYCLKRVIRLRFLNFNDAGFQAHTMNFIDDFKLAFEQLSGARSTQELTHIIQGFFKEAFDVPARRVMLHVCSMASDHSATHTSEHIVAQAIHIQDGAVHGLINKHKILVYDEIEFTNFYEDDEHKSAALDFLDELNADIFLPVYDKQKIIAYLVVERHARKKAFNNTVERDEMLLFAAYLGNILSLLRQVNTQTLLCREQELKQELYNNRQEMNQYKESIRSFLHGSTQHDIGIIFYKARRFIFGNQAAKELVNININTQEGHPLTQALKHVARRVEEFKSPQTYFTKDTTGTRMVICGVPNLETSNVIIMVYYPEISDIISKQMALLKDPHNLDYLLYLETTQAGALINQLIPASGELMLHCKINFLKIALSKKITLLEFHDDDLVSVVELLHHISKRETLHTITLQAPEKNSEIGTKIFGSNSTLGLHSTTPSLFKMLDTTGTLLIKNIEFLELETQDHLVGYMLYGNYRMLKGDQNIATNVQVICSTGANLQELVEQGSFSKALCDLLQPNKLSFPSLKNIPDQELFDLIDGFAEQALTTQTFKNLLTLSDKEKTKLLVKRPESLYELKTKVHHALIQKSKKHQIYDQAHFDPAYEVTDPELLSASRLGKHALRDPKIMALLWNKFRSQNQIATFLGVNRSSVNRRCKDYDLQ